MPILYGTVAYREDKISDYEREIQSWELTRTYEHPIGCPGGCAEMYRLILEINASDENAAEYIDLIHAAMERHGCGAHEARIRINPPNPR